MRVVIGNAHYWGSPIKVEAHFLAEAMAKSKGIQVLFVSHPLSPLHVLTMWKKDVRYRFRQWFWGPKKAMSNLKTFVPFALFPRPRRRFFEQCFFALNLFKFTIPPMHYVLTKKKFKNPDVCIVTDPLFISLVEVVAPKVLIYAMADDYSCFPHFPACVRLLEEAIIRKSDIVVFWNKPLLERVKSFSPSKMLYLPRGVDFGMFSNPCSMPQEYRTIPPPRAIYVGTIESWVVDFELVKICARRLPEVSFVFIGPFHSREVRQAGLLRLSNVHFIGPRPFGSIPAYLQHGHVGLIPFKRAPGIDVVNPVKLLQYLAAGLPVVATRTPGIESTGAPIVMAESPGEFVEALRKALAGEFDKEELRKFARKFSWGKVLAILFEAIAEVGREKGLKLELPAVKWGEGQHAPN